MHLFRATYQPNGEGRLNREDSHHAGRVLRLNPGDAILVTEGRGKIHRAEITAVEKDALHFRSVELRREEPVLPRLAVGIAPTKSNDRFAFFLEKATELGVDEVYPLLCAHSERRHYKKHRGEKVMAAAARQSQRAHWPEFYDMQPFDRFLEKYAAHYEQRYIAWCGPDEKADLRQVASASRSCLILIGPEGDFSPGEVESARDRGYQPVQLGDRRLRTETAGIAAVTMVRYGARE